MTKPHEHAATDRAMRHSPDDLRARGWTVAVHNDYMLDGVAMTFWLLTHAGNGRFVKGEGLTDVEALDQCRSKVGSWEALDKVKRRS